MAQTIIYEPIYPLGKGGLKIISDSKEIGLLDNFCSTFGTSEIKVKDNFLVANYPWGGLLVYDLVKKAVTIHKGMEGHVEAYLLEKNLLYVLCHTFNVESKKIEYPYQMATINLENKKIEYVGIKTDLQIFNAGHMLIHKGIFYLVIEQSGYETNLWLIDSKNNKTQSINIKELSTQLDIENNRSINELFIHENKIMVFTRHVIFQMDLDFTNIKYKKIPGDQIMEKFRYQSDLYYTLRDQSTLYKTKFEKLTDSSGKKRKHSVSDVPKTKKNCTEEAKSDSKYISRPRKCKEKEEIIKTPMEPLLLKTETVMDFPFTNYNSYTDKLVHIKNTTKMGFLIKNTVYIYNFITKEKLFTVDIGTIRYDNMTFEFFSPMPNYLCTINAVHNILGGNYQCVVLINCETGKKEKIEMKEMFRRIRFFEA